MRALALATALEESAGDRRAALGELTAFLVLFAETDYSYSLLRQRPAAEAVLAAFLDGNPQSGLCAPAEALMAAMRAE